MYVIIDTLKVRDHMNKNLLCAERLADSMGVSNSTVSHLLQRGRYSRIQDKNLYFMADLFKVEPSSLVANLLDVEKRKKEIEREIKACESIERTGRIQWSGYDKKGMPATFSSEEKDKLAAAKRKQRLEKELAYIITLL